MRLIIWLPTFLLTGFTLFMLLGRLSGFLLVSDSISIVFTLIILIISVAIAVEIANWVSSRHWPGSGND